MGDYLDLRRARVCDHCKYTHVDGGIVFCRVSFVLVTTRTAALIAGDSERELRYIHRTNYAI